MEAVEHERRIPKGQDDLIILVFRDPTTKELIDVSDRQYAATAVPSTADSDSEGPSVLWIPDMTSAGDGTVYLWAQAADTEVMVDEAFWDLWQTDENGKRSQLFYGPAHFPRAATPMGDT